MLFLHSKLCSILENELEIYKFKICKDDESIFWRSRIFDFVLVFILFWWEFFGMESIIFGFDPFSFVEYLIVFT